MGTTFAPTQIPEPTMSSQTMALSRAPPLDRMRGQPRSGTLLPGRAPKLSGSRIPITPQRNPLREPRIARSKLPNSCLNGADERSPSLEHASIAPRACRAGAHRKVSSGQHRWPRRGSVGPSEHGFFRGRQAAQDAPALPCWLLERYAAHRGLGLFFDLVLALSGATPVRARKAFFDCGLEFIVVSGLAGVGLAKRQRALVERGLDFVEGVRHRPRQALLRHK